MRTCYWQYLLLIFSLGLLLIVGYICSQFGPLRDRITVIRIFGWNATAKYDDEGQVISITCPKSIRDPLGVRIVQWLHLPTACKIQDKETLPPEIGRFTKLEKLTLRKGSLVTLPPEIGQLTRLEALWLDDNKLTAIPPEIGQLANLRLLG